MDEMPALSDRPLDPFVAARIGDPARDSRPVPHPAEDALLCGRGRTEPC